MGGATLPLGLLHQVQGHDVTFLPISSRNKLSCFKMSHHDPELDEVTPKESGSEITIRPRGFHIVWGKDTRYWQLPEKGKEEAAELKQVCWLEITGSVDVEAGKTYSIEFEVSMKPDAFGWSGCPVFMMAKVGKKGKYTWKKITTLDEKRTTTTSSSPFLIPDTSSRLIINPLDNNKLFFGLYEVWSGKWKGGLLIHKAIIKPIQK